MARIVRVRYMRPSEIKKDKNMYQVDFDSDVWDSFIGREVWSKAIRARDEMEAYKIGMEWLRGDKSVEVSATDAGIG